jgi:hypothetical protein
VKYIALSVKTFAILVLLFLLPNKHSYANSCSEIVSRLKAFTKLDIYNPRHATGDFISARLEEVSLDNIYKRITSGALNADPNLFFDFVIYSDEVKKVLAETLLQAQRQIPILRNEYINSFSPTQRAISYAFPTKVREFRITKLNSLNRKIKHLQLLIKRAEELSLAAKNNFHFSISDELATRLIKYDLNDDERYSLLNLVVFSQLHQTLEVSLDHIESRFAHFIELDSSNSRVALILLRADLALGSTSESKTDLTNGFYEFINQTDKTPEEAALAASVTLTNELTLKRSSP